MTRDLGGKTQNSNQSFNSIVSHLSLKHLNFGQKIDEIAAYMAAGIFNDGRVLSTMQLLHITIDQQCKNCADAVDTERIAPENRIIFYQGDSYSPNIGNPESE